MAALIAAHMDEHQIPHATVYRACPGPGSGGLPPRAALAAEARRLFKAHRGACGSPRITAELRAIELEQISPPTASGIKRAVHPDSPCARTSPVRG